VIATRNGHGARGIGLLLILSSGAFSVLGLGFVLLLTLRLH
jgi:hypothetical protein